MYVYAIRKCLGGFVFTLGGVDVITFAGGTGEGSSYIRRRILEGLDGLGILLDYSKNESCAATEYRISSEESKVEVWVVPTNEELVVVRECYNFLSQGTVQLKLSSAINR